MLNLDSFIENLKEFIKQSNVFSCYAITTKTNPITGTKIKLSLGQIQDFFKATVEYLCDKVYSRMQLGDFPAASPKEYIEMLPSSDERIKPFCDSLAAIVSSPELNNTKLSNFNAYMLTSRFKDKPCYFVTSKNPFISYKKNNFLYTLANNNYTIVEDNIVRLVMHFDCIILQDKCYFVNLQGKKLFGLEQNAIQKSQQAKSDLLQRDILVESAKELLENYMKKPGKAFCLAYIDNYVFDELNNITPKNYKKIAQKYKLNIIRDHNGAFNIDVSTEEKMKDFIDTITNKRCLDFDQNVVNCAAPFIRRLP